ncbi:MAG: hypothetical protein H7829_06435 [Magnetococcus sp. THC-1_WYH]
MLYVSIKPITYQSKPRATDSVSPISGSICDERPITFLPITAITMNKLFKFHNVHFPISPVAITRLLISKIRPEIMPPAHKGSRIAWLIFLAALLFSVCLKFSITIIPILERPIPVEVDDSFARIFHSVRIINCFFQHCPALVSLDHQAASFPGNLAAEDYGVWDTWVRATIFSEPWPNLLAWGLHRLGFSLVDSHNLLVSFYPLLVMSAIGYWLLASFGPGPAGLALILIAVMDNGLLLFRPNEFSLGLGLITWAQIRRQGASSARFLFFMVFLMSGWHTIGKVWSVVSLLVYGWFARRPLTKTEKKWLIGTVGLVLLSFLIPPLLVNGTGVPTLDGILSLSLMKLLLFHWPVILILLKDLIIFFKNPMFLVILLGIGFLSLSKQERINNIFWMTLLGMLLLTSFIDYQPAHPGHLMARFWVMVVILLIGLFSYGIYHGVNRIRRMAVELWQTESDTSKSTCAMFIFVLILGFFLALADQLVFQVYYTLKATSNVIQRFTTRHDYALGPEQPRLLNTDSYPCKTALYFDVTLAMYYFSYGGYHCGALQYSGNPKSKAWLNAQPNITHLVTWNPVTKNYGNFPSSPQNPITVHLDDKTAEGDWNIGLVNSGLDPVKIRLQQPTGKPLLDKELPAKWAGWWNVGSVAPFVGQRLVLAPVDNATILLTGMRVGDTDQSRLRWPWDQGIMFSINDAKTEGGTRFFRFLSPSLWPNSHKTITVLDDTGSSLLATVQ